MKTYFDSTATKYGIVRYFVCPNDDFALNSMEIVNSDEYLYRLLKKDGYERIIFVEVDKTNCKVYAYDKLSELSFLNSTEFKKVDIHNEASLNGFYKKAIEKKEKNNEGPSGLGFGFSEKPMEAVSVKETGLREVKRFEAEKGLISFFDSDICAALESKNVKTAVVMQAYVLEKAIKKDLNNAPAVSTALTRIIKVLNKYNKNRNVLILTSPSKDSMVEMFQNHQLKDFHSANITNLFKSTPDVKVSITNAVNELKDAGCVITCDRIGDDEIANVLFYKKHVEKAEGFDNIPTSKIYPLAAKLRSHLLMKEEIFKEIAYREESSYVRALLAQLDRREAVEELVSVAKSLPPKSINRVSRHCLELERICHEHTDYVEREDEKEVLEAFDKLVGKGMEDVKKEVFNSIKMFEEERKDYEAKKLKGKRVSQDDMPFMNMRFVGPPGTGKTTVAKLAARLFHSRGILPTDDVEYVNASKLMKSNVGAIAEAIHQLGERSNGGVLVIDEIYALINGHSAGNTATEAINALMAVIDRYRNTLCIIACGYEEKVNKFFEFNEGVNRRIPWQVEFKNYDVDELMAILNKQLEDSEMKLEPEAEELVKKLFNTEISIAGEKFGNAGYIKDKLLPRFRRQYSSRGGADGIYTCEDVLNAFPERRGYLEGSNESEEEILSVFDKFVGSEMQSIKNTVVTKIKYFVHKRNQYMEAMKEGNPNGIEMPYMHFKFIGPPGTGKTQVAKLVAKLLYKNGILPGDKVKETSASALVKSNGDEIRAAIMNAANEAKGGVLFIDEFYAFNQGHSNGNIIDEAAPALLDVINNNSNNLCLIVAGYEKDVNRVLDYNGGFDGRVPNKIVFPNYSVDSLMEIFNFNLNKYGYSLADDGVRELIRKIVCADQTAKGENFNNARYIEQQLFNAIEEQYSGRGGSDKIFTLEDVKKAFPEYDDLEIVPLSDGKNNVGTPRASKHKYHRISSEDIKKWGPPPNLAGYNKESTTEEERRSMIKGAILYLKTDLECGTGFLISPDGYALTCCHVIKGATDIKAKRYLKVDGKVKTVSYNCVVINADAGLDMALLKLESDEANKVKDLPYLPVADRAPRDAEGFTLSGFPMGKKGDIISYTGLIANETGMKEVGWNYYNIQGEAKHGNSGSPLFSFDGEVIGILYGSDKLGPDEMNKMRPAYYFWDRFCEENSVKVEKNF